MEKQENIKRKGFCHEHKTKDCDSKRHNQNKQA